MTQYKKLIAAIALLVVSLLFMGAQDWRIQGELVVQHTVIDGDPLFRDKVQSYLVALGQHRALSQWLIIIRGYHVSFTPALECPGAMCATMYTVKGRPAFIIEVQPGLAVSNNMGAAMIVHELQHLKDARRGCTQNPANHLRAWQETQKAARVLDVGGLQGWIDGWLGIFERQSVEPLDPCV